MSRNPHLYSIYPVPGGTRLSGLPRTGRVRRPMTWQTSRHVNAHANLTRRCKAVTDGRRGVAAHEGIILQIQFWRSHRFASDFRFLPALKCGASAKGVL